MKTILTHISDEVNEALEAEAEREGRSKRKQVLRILQERYGLLVRNGNGTADEEAERRTA